MTVGGSRDRRSTLPVPGLDIADSLSFKVRQFDGQILRLTFSPTGATEGLLAVSEPFDLGKAQRCESKVGPYTVLRVLALDTTSCVC